jgi:hypothetical protein
MGNISDNVKMSEPVRFAPKPEATLPAIEEARNAVISFLQKMPEVKRVNITKLAVLDAEKGTWEAEAEVWVPNPTIKALSLPIQREVLDCQRYLLRLDKELNISAYGLKESVV